MKRLRQWLAGGRRPPEDAVMILAPDADRFGQASALIEALTRGDLRVSTVLIAANADEAAHLSKRFPGALIRVPPALAPVQASLAALRVRAVIAIETDRLNRASARLFRGALKRDVPVYAAEAAESATGAEIGPAAIDAPGETAVPRQPDRSGPDPGGAGSALWKPDAARLNLKRRSAVGDRAQGALPPGEAAALLARGVGVERGLSLSLDRLAGRVARSGPARLTGGFLRRIDSLDALRERLGGPATVLCLGNGPSSAAAEVASFPHDALLRVNLDWRGGGVLTAPDMVFVGVKRAMRRLDRVPLGVATPRKEAALIACRLFEPWHGPATYAVAETLAREVIPPNGGPLRPTTGAYMLAVAVALAPARLAIAGIDMFSHPEGAYPPGTDPTPGGSVNAFAPSHDFDTDAAFIAACLGRYRGELIVFGTALAELVRGRCVGSRFSLTEIAATPAN